jgi:chromosome segregation ATPase
MDNQEQEQLSDIHDEVKGSHAQLGRIDERTRNMERNLNGLSDEIQANREDIDNLQSEVKRNTTVINAVSLGLSGLVIWAADKAGRFLPW